ncbi:hypothetical protein NIES23_42570 [Trichormus variabilis NIES-23]|uniref:Uncharacterized protein n=1 Tax=Trichormus variabilis NIES-23 TaxID=1973479 RepID=A0A1Z4KR11_ANAVA|nr:hypothetical protein NIES23_42570 [Trichormus variabilis NIES-23]
MSSVKLSNSLAVVRIVVLASRFKNLSILINDEQSEPFTDDFG